MPVSITGRSSRHPARTVALLTAMAAATAGLLSACGAGQIAQTDSQRPTVSGLNLDSADGSVSLRDLAVVYNDPSGYPGGSTAPLSLRVVNNSPSAPVTLLRVSVVDGAGTVVLEGGSPATGVAATPPVAVSVPGTATGTPPAASPARGPFGRSAAPSSASRTSPVPPTSPVSTASPGGGGASPSASATSGHLSVRIPADGYVSLVPGTGGYLAVTGTGTGLAPGRTIHLIFDFDNGQRIDAVNVPFGLPTAPAPRSPLDLPTDGERG